MGEKVLSAAETELYDRQIRLWGLESQEKLRAANVLLIGIRGLGSEVAKNILLSGINSLTILDEGEVTEEELSVNFLLSPDSLGKKIADAVLTKAQALNPLVKITADTESVSEKPEKYFSNFTIVAATRLTTKQLFSVSNICRSSKVQFICGDVFGLFGYTLADFQEHVFYVDQVKLPVLVKRNYEGKPTTTKLRSKINYPSIETALSTSLKKIVKPVQGKRNRRNELYYLMRLLIQFRDQYGRNPSGKTKEDDIAKLKIIREEILQKFLITEEKLKDEMFNVVFGECVPICAIIGGVMAQEVIKAVSHKEVPINNLFLFNPHTFSGKEETIGV